MIKTRRSTSPFRCTLHLGSLLMCLLSGCATHNTEHYYWGQYEQMLYEAYTQPGKAPPEQQIQQLTQDIAQATERARPVAPGVYFYLGYLHLLAGNQASAMNAFQNEKQAFPESAHFINSMLTDAQ